MEFKFVLFATEQDHVWAQWYCVRGEVIELGPMAGVFQTQVVPSFLLGRASPAS